MCGYPGGFDTPQTWPGTGSPQNTTQIAAKSVDNGPPANKPCREIQPPTIKNRLSRKALSCGGRQNPDVIARMVDDMIARANRR